MSKRAKIRVSAIAGLMVVCTAICAAIAVGAFSQQGSNQTRDTNWDFKAPSDVISESSDKAADLEEAFDSEKSSEMNVSDEADRPVITDAVDGDYVSNQVLVSFDGSIDEAKLRELMGKEGVTVTDVQLVSKSLDGNGVLVQVSYEGEEDPLVVAGRLAQSPFATTAEPNYMQTFCDADDAPSFGGKQALLVATDDVHFSNQWALGAVGASAAWDIAKTERTVTVAVLDSGVDWDHPDLAQNLILGNYAKNTYSETTGANAVDDLQGHGTHVAGIIAAAADNSMGVAGVSYNAMILPIKVSYGASGSIRTSDVIKGIDYVVDLKTASDSPANLKGIRVINLSLGSYNFSETYQAAVQRAHSAGILVVAAAGNDHTNKVLYPSGYPYAMSVSALKQVSGGVEFDSSYSNYGSTVDLAAPGTDVYSTIPDGRYGNKSGTSMAAPMVSGAAALLFAANPDLGPDQVQAILEDSAEDLGTSGRDDYYGKGALRLDRALACKHLAKATIEDIPDQLLQGDAAEPDVTVKYGSEMLVKGRDYHVQYLNNSMAGTGTACITGAGNYIGTRQLTFNIYTLNLVGASISAIPSQTYTGKPIEPPITVTYRNAVLNEGVDYEVIYENNVDVGTATVTIEGKGSYYGETGRVFRITARSISAADISDVGRQISTGEALTPDIEATYGEHSLVKDTDYTLSYSDNINPGIATVTIKGKGNFSGSVTKQFEVTAEPIAKPISGTSIPYNGNEQAVVPESDWYVVEGDRVATDAGIYTCTMALKEHAYWGDGTNDPVSFDWRIEPKILPIPQANPDALYIGSEVQGVPDGEGYILSGELTAIEEGSYTVTATLTSRLNYVWKDGTKTPKEITWVLYPERAIEEPQPVEGLVYSGEEQQGIPASSGYVLDGATATNAGEYTARATLNPGYRWESGSHDAIDIDWTIARKPISKPESASYTYDGKLKAPLVELSDTKFVQTSFGFEHYAALDSDGSLYMWGSNNYGQIGIGTYDYQELLVKVLDGVTQVSLGSDHSAAITSDGSLYTWGYNFNGQLGDGTSGNWRPLPTKILSNVAQVSLRYNCSAAITRDGSLYTWGRNLNGQIGDGTSSDRKTPVKVLSNVTQVSLGVTHAAAITRDGSLYMWGGNEYGQLGNGTTATSRSPVKILSNVAQVSLGQYHSAAIMLDGSLYTWGRNQYGQLGDGTTTTSGSPVKILDNVEQVSLGYNHSAAIAKDGSLLMWGLNDYGQAEPNSRTNIKTPTEVPMKAACVQLGRDNSAIITPDGFLYSWGYAHYGGLGGIGVVTLPNDLPYTVEVTPKFKIGEYQATVMPESNYCWEDGTAGEFSFTWQIQPMTVAIPGSIPTIYDGLEHQGFADSDYYTVTGQTDAVESGSYTVTATLSSSNYVWPDGTTEPKELTWTIDPKTVDLSQVVNEGLVYSGANQIGVRSGEGYAITDGTATASAVGTYRATLSLKNDNYIWPDGTTEDKEVEWSITGQPIDMSGVAFNDTAYVYDGLSHDIEVTGDLPDGVTVSYEGNSQSAVGEYEVVAHFTCDLTKYAPIPDMKASLSITPALIDVPSVVDGLTYTGELQTGIVLPEAAPYDLDGPVSAINAGKYKVILSLRDKETSAWNLEQPTTDDIELIWLIAQESIVSADIVPIDGRVFTGLDITPVPVVAFGGKQLEKGKDYALAYEGNRNVGKAKIVIAGKGNFTDSTSLEFDITPREISIEDISGLEDRKFTGFEQEQSLVVMVEGVELTVNDDYEVDYTDNVTAGTATATVKGKGNYSGEVPVTFKILPAVLSGENVSTIKSMDYSGAALEPKPVVKVGDTELVEDTDYTLKFRDNTNAGIATVTVVGQGNYSGEIDTTFTINPATLDESYVSEIGNVEYTGDVLEPKPVVKRGDEELVENADYVLEYQDNIDCGTAAVIITGIGNYTGTITRFFDIEEAPLPPDTLEVPETPVVPALSLERQMGADGTAFGAGASAAAAEKALGALNSDNDPAGTVFNALQLKAAKVTRTSVKLSWKRVVGANSYAVYGNKCGKANKYAKLAITAGASATVKKIAGKKVAEGTYYKFLVIAFDKNGNVLSTSKAVHVATAGGKVGNHKKVATAAKKNKVSIKAKKTFKLKAKAAPASKKLKVKKHRAIKYETSDEAIATVSPKGVVKGLKKGTCFVYAYAQNGVCAKVKVTVK